MVVFFTQMRALKRRGCLVFPGSVALSGNAVSGGLTLPAFPWLNFKSSATGFVINCVLCIFSSAHDCLLLRHDAVINSLRRFATSAKLKPPPACLSPRPTLEFRTLRIGAVISSRAS